MADKTWNVVGSLAQGGQQEREDIESIIKVAAESAVGGHLCQIAVRRRDETHVDLDRLVAAETLEFLFLQHAQQLGLQLQGNVTHLVEKKCPAVGQFKAPDLLRNGAGEGTFFVAKQLAFQKSRGNGGTIELDERSAAASTEPCSARAISSLPVPVSPYTKTVDSVGATVSTLLRISRRAVFLPMISPKLCSVRNSSAR